MNVTDTLLIMAQHIEDKAVVESILTGIVYDGKPDDLLQRLYQSNFQGIGHSRDDVVMQLIGAYGYMHLIQHMSPSIYQITQIARDCSGYAFITNTHKFKGSVYPVFFKDAEKATLLLPSSLTYDLPEALMTGATEMYWLANYPQSATYRLNNQPEFCGLYEDIADAMAAATIVGGDIEWHDFHPFGKSRTGSTFDIQKVYLHDFGL